MIKWEITTSDEGVFIVTAITLWEAARIAQEGYCFNSSVLYVQPYYGDKKGINETVPANSPTLS